MNVHSGDDVVLHAEPAEQAQVLEGPGKSRAGDLIGLLSRDFLIIEENPSFGGRVDSRDYVEQRGLSGAVGADDSDDLAFVYLDVDIRQGCEAAETLCDFLYFQNTHFLLPFPALSCLCLMYLKFTLPRIPSGLNSRMITMIAP